MVVFVFIVTFRITAWADNFQLQQINQQISISNKTLQYYKYKHWKIMHINLTDSRLIALTSSENKNG